MNSISIFIYIGKQMYHILINLVLFSFLISDIYMFLKQFGKNRFIIDINTNSLNSIQFKWSSKFEHYLNTFVVVANININKNMFICLRLIIRLQYYESSFSFSLFLLYIYILNNKSTSNYLSTISSRNMVCDI